MLIGPAAYPQEKQCIEEAQSVKLKTRYIAVYNYSSEIFDIYIYRIQQEYSLFPYRLKLIHIVEYRRCISQKCKEYIIQILDIPEKYIHGRKNHSDTYVHYYQTYHRYDQAEEVKVKRYMIHCCEYKIYNDRKTEIDKRRYILREKEQVFGNIYLGENVCISHK